MSALSHVLVINPNTSHSVTQRLVQQLALGLPGLQLHGATAAFGAPYITDEHSYCIAGHAVLDAWTSAQKAAPVPGYAAVLVGCFGDPGLAGLREVVGVPVIGLAEGAVQAMQALGYTRIAIVTGGEKWQAMLERWSRAHGHDRTQAPVQIVQITTLPATGMQLMQSPQAAVQALAQCSAQVLQHRGAQAVLLGGAGLAGLGAQVRASTGLPVWDCVEVVQPCVRSAVAAQEQAPVPPQSQSQLVQPTMPPGAK